MDKGEVKRLGDDIAAVLRKHGVLTERSVANLTQVLLQAAPPLQGQTAAYLTLGFQVMRLHPPIEPMPSPPEPDEDDWAYARAAMLRVFNRHIREWPD